jgi:hypothetical protein
VTAIVLAPLAFYKHRGKRVNTATRAMLDLAVPRLGVDVRLATWNHQQRQISELSADLSSS